MISGFGAAGRASYGQGTKANGKTFMSYPTREFVN